MRSSSAATSPRAERAARAGERGLTLMEVTVVSVLASLVTLALIGFYINSQSTWTDASAQAITQRELTSAVERMTRQVHGARAVLALASPPALYLYRDVAGADELCHFVWATNSDSLLWEVDPDGQKYPLGASVVTAFQVQVTDSLVHLRLLEMRSGTGQTVSLATAMARSNRP